MKGYLLFHKEFIVKNREWRGELVKFVEQKITENKLRDLLSEVVRKT